MRKTRRQDTSSHGCAPGAETYKTHRSLAYDFHEDLLPVLTGLESPSQSRRLREAGELLLDEVLPLKEVGVRLKGGFPLVRGLGRQEVKCQGLFHLLKI